MSYCRMLLHALLLLLITPGLAIHTQAEIHVSVEDSKEQLDAYAQMQRGVPITYDGFLKLLDDLENDRLENKYNLDDLDLINHFLVSCARQGLLPSDNVEELEADIEELLSHNHRPEFVFWTDHTYSFSPLVLYGSFPPTLCKSWGQKAWKNTKKWVKKHKKPLIIAAAVVVSAVTVAVIVSTGGSAAPAVAGAASAAGAACAEGSSSNSKDNQEELDPKLKASLVNEIVSFKEVIDREQFLDPKNTDLSIEENGRVLKDAFTYQGFDAFQKEEATKEPRQTNLGKNGPIEIVFSADGSSYSVRNSDLGVEGNLYQLRGQRSLDLHSYDQAIRDFGKCIELNPNNHEAYLDRATAYLKSGEYERSLADYQQYVAQKSTPLKYALDFSQDFATGLSKGVKESGCQLSSFAYNAVIHPIDTTAEIGQAIAVLSTLICSQEWETIGEILVPEVYELAEKWDSISAKEKVYHSGYVFGKYGADIFIPGASAKILSKGSQGTKELAKVCKSFKNAEKTAALEALTNNSSVASESISQLSTTERSAQVSKAIVTEESLGWILPPKGGATINGRWYTEHALERMAPRGLLQNGTDLVSRGVPPSVVENAIKFGTKKLSSTGQETIHTFENIRVVTSLDGNRVVTVITIGN